MSGKDHDEQRLRRDIVRPDVQRDAQGVLHVQSLHGKAPRKSFLHRTLEHLHRTQHHSVVEDAQHHMHSRVAHVTVGAVSATKLLDPFCAASVALSAAKFTAAHSEEERHHRQHHREHRKHRQQGHHHSHGATDHDRSGHTTTGPGAADHGAPAQPLAAQPPSVNDPKAPINDDLVAGFVLGKGMGSAMQGGKAPLIRPDAQVPTSIAQSEAPEGTVPSAPRESDAGSASDPKLSALESRGVRLQKLHGEGEGGVTMRVLQAAQKVAEHPAVKAVTDVAHKAIHNPYVMGSAAVLYGYLAMKTGGGLDFASFPDAKTGFDMLKLGVYSVTAVSAGATAVELVSERALQHLERQHQERVEAHGRSHQAALDAHAVHDPSGEGVPQGNTKLPARWERGEDGTLTRRFRTQDQADGGAPAAPKTTGPAAAAAAPGIPKR